VLADDRHGGILAVHTIAVCELHGGRAVIGFGPICLNFSGVLHQCRIRAVDAFSLNVFQQLDLAGRNLYEAVHGTQGVLSHILALQQEILGADFFFHAAAGVDVAGTAGEVDELAAWVASLPLSRMGIMWVIVVLYLILQKYIIKGMVAGAVKG